MKPVAYSRDNVDKCWCGQCPVQIGSKCAITLYQGAGNTASLPEPEHLGGLYCATGAAICDDIDIVKMCNCAACLVWSENELASNHYCVHGSAGDIGR